ncbi:MAG: hypothetical protein WBX50_00630 [Candidatus Deferrimicrobiaceae bacterium]
MRHLIKYTVAALVVFMGLSMGHYSWAGPAGSPPVAPADEWSVTGFGNPLSSTELGEESGQAAIQIDEVDIHLVNSDQNGYLGQNALIGTTNNGENSITGNAFSNMSGFATVIQNSGNQVLIQDTTIVDVTVK